MQEHDIVASIRALPRDATVVIEANAQLAEALSGDGYHVVLVGAESAKVPWVATYGDMNDRWSALTCRNPEAACLGSEALCRIVDSASLRTRVNTTTSLYRARGWLQNLVRNLHFLTRPTAMQAEGLAGVPAFIVGAGSSLDRNHSLLPEAARRGIVIGVNASSRLPGVDIALTVECNDLRFKLGPLEHVGLRAFSMISDPAVMEHGAGALLPIYAGELGALVGNIVGIPKLACSGHGGTAAVSLAERLGCDPIVLVGHDFALEDGGRIYPECLGIGDSRVSLDGGTWRMAWDAQLKAQPRHNPLHEAEPVVSVPGRDGGMVTSTMGLASTLHWLQSVATSGTGLKLWNASEWGADVRGWENLSLADALERLPERAFEIRVGAGVSPDRLLTWLSVQERKLRKVQHAARRMSGERNPLDRSQELLDVLQTAPLLEPWCQAHISHEMETRRSKPMLSNRWSELRLAERTARAIGTTLVDEAELLMAEIVTAKERICAAR